MSGKSKQSGYCATCSICGRLLKNSTLSLHKQSCAPLCSHRCEQLMSVTAAFLQGVVIGRSLCALFGHQSCFYDYHCDTDAVEDDNFANQDDRELVHDEIEKSCCALFHIRENTESIAEGTNPKNSCTLPVDDDVDSSSMFLKRKNVGFENVSSRAKKKAGLALIQNKKPRGKKVKTDESPKMRRGNKGANSKICPADSSQCFQNAEQFSNKKECSECGASFKNDRGLHHHIAMKHRGISADVKKRSNLSCKECGKTYSNYEAHCKKWHSEKSTVFCRLCSKPFKSWTGRTLHMRVVHKVEKPQECEVCGERFSCHREYQHHKAHHHMHKSVCHICGKKFKFKNALKLHLDAHAGIKRHFCEVCGKGFVRITTLCSHRAVVHPTNKEKYFQCDKCPETFSTKWVLNKHLLSKHACGTLLKSIEKNCLPVSDDSNCQACKDAVVGSSQCPAHSKQGNFVCKVCNMSYSSVIQYLQHMKQNHEDKIFQCQSCGKTFSSLQYLKAHMKQHQEPRFACDVCGKKFTYKCNLNAHRSSHYSEKPFQCNVCMKSFRLKFLLKCHMRCHNQELQYICPICGKGFTRQQNVKRHIHQMHSDQEAV
ncbi:zinc finger protein 58-like [Pomacea canaliculata]|nr:zinc finger protein 58-like [Pomacea canaliculata]